jgi:hypothetical protein
MIIKITELRKQEIIKEEKENIQENYFREIIRKELQESINDLTKSEQKINSIEITK